MSGGVAEGAARGMPSARCATIFDLDDTLVDSGDAWGRVCAAFAARHGHRWRPEDDEALHGNGDWASYVAGLCGGGDGGGDGSGDDGGGGGGEGGGDGGDGAGEGGDGAGNGGYSGSGSRSGNGGGDRSGDGNAVSRASWASRVSKVGKASRASSVTTAEVLETCTAAMAEECAAGRVKALPGAVDLVFEAERHGPVGMATASPRRYVLAALESLGLAGRMRTVVCGEDVARNKPAPDAYLRAAAELGAMPSDCVAVEDSPRGIHSAASAGMRVLAVPRGGMTLPADVAHLPAAHARDAADALPLLTMMLTSIIVITSRPEPEPAVHGGTL